MKEKTSAFDPTLTALSAAVLVSLVALWVFAAQGPALCPAIMPPVFMCSSGDRQILATTTSVVVVLVASGALLVDLRLRKRPMARGLQLGAVALAVAGALVLVATAG